MVRRTGFCLMINALLEGPVPSLTDADGRVWIFPTRLAAEREIADLLVTCLEEFLDGERDFDDAMTVEEYVVEVVLAEDGFAIDESGNRFAFRIADENEEGDARSHEGAPGC